MAHKFHNGPNGPAPCSATKRPCPVGGEHFATQEEAETAYAKTMEAEHGVAPSLKKPASSAHWDEALEGHFDSMEPVAFDDENGGYAATSNTEFLEAAGKDPEFRAALEGKMREAGLEGSYEDVRTFAPRWQFEERASVQELQEEDEWNREALRKFKRGYPQVDFASDGRLPSASEAYTQAKKAKLSPQELGEFVLGYDRLMAREASAYTDRLLQEEGSLTREVEVGGEPYILMARDEDPWAE